MDKKKERLLVEISKEVKRDFKIWCINHGVTMGQKIEEVLKTIMKSNQG